MRSFWGDGAVQVRRLSVVADWDGLALEGNELGVQYLRLLRGLDGVLITRSLKLDDFH